MGIFEFLVTIIPVALFFSIPLYAINVGHRQKKEKLEIRRLQEEKELERLRQENFLLENKHMQLELDRMKEESGQRRLDESRESRWLIKDTDEENKEKKTS
ncbi:hypothetical protein [Salinicoccus roseus]|uniref:hypothetical protein n=1 Tax=Salinicoccus roseus TaxID=45670 RepID=UPI00230121DC|nr:hypothetical protein [Salinicoccus roseus]